MLFPKMSAADSQEDDLYASPDGAANEDADGQAQAQEVPQQVRVLEGSEVIVSG